MPNPAQTCTRSCAHFTHKNGVASSISTRACAGDYQLAWYCQKVVKVQQAYETQGHSTDVQAPDKLSRNLMRAPVQHLIRRGSLASRQADNWKNWAEVASDIVTMAGMYMDRAAYQEQSPSGLVRELPKCSFRQGWSPPSHSLLEVP